MIRAREEIEIFEPEGDEKIYVGVRGPWLYECDDHDQAAMAKMIIECVPDYIEFGRRAGSGDWSPFRMVKEAMSFAYELVDRYKALGEAPRLRALEDPRPTTRGQRCRVCGCTDDDACFPSCRWVEIDLCSECTEDRAPVAQLAPSTD